MAVFRIISEDIGFIVLVTLFLRRPGLLIIVNGVDYLITGDDYVLKEMDEVDFISVLHGG